MPTQIGVGSAGVWSPFWVQNGAAFGAGVGTNMLTERANMTYVPNATLAHPHYHATTNPNPHWMKIDMSTAGVTTVAVTDAGYAANPPDSTRRWGHIKRFLFYKDGNPTSQAPFAEQVLGKFKLNTDGYLEISPTDAGTYRSISALPTGSAYMIELWFIPKDSSGANLVGRTGAAAVQVVVRIDTNPGGTPALSTIMNVLAEGASAISLSHLQFEVGDTSTHGAVNFYYSNFYGPNWEDADAPYGAVRVEEYIPTADYDSGFTTGSFADWDEAGPDDVTTRIQQGTYAASANELSETVANGAGGTSGVSASDAVICANTVWRAVTLVADGKGASVSFYQSIHDGTTLAKRNCSPQVTDWGSQTRFWRTDASAAAWVQSALANLKIGASYDTVVAAPSNRSFSADRAYVAWVKAGEEYAAVPAIVRSDPPFPRRPIRNLLVTR
jgi:hypothetical protein